MFSMNFFSRQIEDEPRGKDLLHVKCEWTMMKTTCYVRKSTLSNLFFISVNHVCNDHHVRLKLILNYYRLTHHLSLRRGLQECNHLHNFIVKENYCMKFKDLNIQAEVIKHTPMHHFGWMLIGHGTFLIGFISPNYPVQIDIDILLDALFTFTYLKV